MLLSQLYEETGSVKGPLPPGVGSKWDARIMFLQKSNGLLPTAKCRTSPPQLAALLCWLQTYFCPGTKLFAADTATSHLLGKPVKCSRRGSAASPADTVSWAKGS